MDPMISLGQKNTLAEYMILSGADNRLPMLDKDLYDSWKSRMELYMQNREHGRMILESVENGPLIWLTVEENSVIRTKKYAELSAAEKIQADCDMKATNIILQGLPADIYSLVNHHRVAKDLWERVQLLMQCTSLTKQERECFAVPVFSPGDDPIACLNKAMVFLTVGRQGQNYSGNTYKSNATSSREIHKWTVQEIVKCYNTQVKDIWTRQCTQQSDQGMHMTEGSSILIDSACDGSLRLHKRFLWPTFSTMVLTLSQSSREKMIDSQIDDMIREKLALKEQIDSLEQNLYKQIKEE
ncbi:hypothetical protein Tco_0908643 [Tanacetum coccineum]|uniref:Integrase, catalytic region, zinc finger, CCHC-type, peptidase aspartic, catalytic n=1 Tax=Tanacetum coccineum TaxID=301880 RepID=A0ABQ5CPX0_9ASTR